MENASPHPVTMNTLRYGAASAFAMLVGMQLEAFTFHTGYFCIYPRKGIFQKFTAIGLEDMSPQLSDVP
jgi:hypothetical protein